MEKWVQLSRGKVRLVDPGTDFRVEEPIAGESMLEDVDLSSPGESPGKALCQIVQDGHDGLVLLVCPGLAAFGVLEVGEGGGECQHDVVLERRVHVDVGVVLRVEPVVGGIGGDGVVEGGAVEVVAAVRILTPALLDQLADAEHGGEEETVLLHPTEVLLVGHWGSSKGPD